MNAKLFGLPAPLVVVGGAAAAYVLYSRYKSKAAAATAASSSAPAASSSGTGTGGTDAGTAAAIANVGQQQAQANQELANELQSDLQANFASLEAQIAQMFPTPPASSSPPPTSPPPTSPPPTSPPATPPTTTNSQPPPPPPSPGLGIVQTSLGPMVWLGLWGQPHYQVGGGAPVYFGNATNLQQGPQAEIAGNDIYTPVAYAGLVSSSAS